MGSLATSSSTIAGRAKPMRPRRERRASIIASPDIFQARTQGLQHHGSNSDCAGEPLTHLVELFGITPHRVSLGENPEDVPIARVVDHRERLALGPVER